MDSSEIKDRAKRIAVLFFNEDSARYMALVQTVENELKQVTENIMDRAKQTAATRILDWEADWMNRNA